MYTVFYFVHLRYEITRDVVCVHASSVVRLASSDSGNLDVSS